MKTFLAVNLMQSIIDSQNLSEISFVLLIEILLSGLVFGLLISALYMFTNRLDGYSKGMAYTLMMLPPILSVLCLVSSNLSGAGSTTVLSAVSIGGALTIIRFRSTQGSPKDLAYIFASLTLGLACGRGYIGVAAVLAVLVSVVMIILMFVRFGDQRNPKKLLKVVVPESLNYVGIFDEILNKYCVHWEVCKVKSSNFGTMFELSYAVNFKKGANQKEMFDEIRCLNGNLNIVLENFVYDVEA